jgi:zinc transporter ZupT
MGFAVLGFFFPIVGLILWLVWRENLPRKAKSCGKGALVGALIWVALYVLIIVLAFVVSSLAIGYGGW